MILTEEGDLYLPGTPGGELAYQRMLTALLPSIAEGYRYAPWAPRIRDNRSRIAQPDSLLWKVGTREWWVVEVELADHSADHIRRQLDILEGGIYDWSLVNSIELALQITSNDARRILAAKPGLLAIFDTFTEKSTAIARSCGFEVAILEPYRTDEGRRAFHIRSIPSWWTLGSRENEFPLRCMVGIGHSVTVELPKYVLLPPGPITIHFADRPPAEASLHAGKIRLPSGILDESTAYFATIVASSPAAIRVERYENQK